MASQIQPDSEHMTSYITLSHKPTVRIAYTFIPSKSFTSASPQPLLIFLTGLGLPQAFYYPIVNQLSSLPTHPAMLTYDRFGQGATTDRDPLDANAEDPKHGHTVEHAVEDLYNLNLAMNNEDLPVIFIANSLGCAIARLYAEKYSNTVSGLVLLDSVLANSDFVSIFPDPDSSTINSSQLPEGITISEIIKTRQIVHRIFYPSQGSGEGLSRKNLASLLPSSDGPRLAYHDGEGIKEGVGPGPWITVVGHGPQKFAEDSFKAMGIPIALTNQYANPYWHEYNVGLTKITSSERARGPIIAEKAGHFIQKDDPELVFYEVKRMLGCMGVDGF
jgi:pimeloyl-ACP methyl ester carboxylesterase